ncbi:MAG: hypothetical protein ACT4PT_06625, partial [Methanobacteriota archaeon]
IEPKKDLDRVKEVKVRIPVTYHIKLHSMKVLTGKQISDTVTEALAEYFGGLKHTIPGEFGHGLEFPDPSASDPDAGPV